MRITKKQLNMLINDIIEEQVAAPATPKSPPAPVPPPSTGKALMGLGAELGQRTDIGDKAMSGDIKGEIRSLTKDPAVVASLVAIHPLAPLAVKSTLALASMYDQYKAGQMKLIDMIMSAGLTDAHVLYKELSKVLRATDKKKVRKILAKRNSLGTTNVLDDEYKLVIHLLAKEGELGYFDTDKNYDLDGWLESAGMTDEASFLRQKLGYSTFFSGEEFDTDVLTDRFKDKEKRERELAKAAEKAARQQKVAVTDMIDAANKPFVLGSPLGGPELYQPVMSVPGMPTANATKAVLSLLEPSLRAYYENNPEALGSDMASTKQKLVNESLSRGSLYRRRYYGRY
jgi:hypothetical protein